RELIDRAMTEQRRETDLRAAAATAAERLEPAQQRARRARAELEAAEKRVIRARTRLDAARAVEEGDRRRADLEHLERLLGTLTEVGDELRRKEAELAAVDVADGSVDAIRRADETLREAVIRSAAS